MESFFLSYELYVMQNNYMNKPLRNIHLSRPAWLNSKDPMSEIYSKKSMLLQQGKVIYAHIVQANTILFHAFPPYDCPAQIVYSTDPYVAENPDILSDIAWKLYNYKNAPEEQIPSEWKEIARVIADEYDRSDFTFSMEFGGNSVEFHMIPTMIYRKLLPKRKLCGSLLPVLTVSGCKQILVLPKQYWTKKFTEFWVKGSI